MLLRPASRLLRRVAAPVSARPLHSWDAYVPRRALLYVPASDARKVAKAATQRVDCVALDCEDGVGEGSKGAAREGVAAALGGGEFPGVGDLSVRVNSAGSPHCPEDLRACLSAPRLPHTLLLPKLESADELAWLDDQVAALLAKRNDPATGDKMRLVVFCESGAALLSLPSLLRRRPTTLTLDAAVLGSDDLCADLGITRTAVGEELLYARQRFVACVRSARLQAIDMVWIDFKDIEGLKKQSLQGAGFGFTGKQVIHPGQVQTVQEAFSPSPERREWAEQLLLEWAEHQRRGTGAFTFRGAMIDMPLVLQAQNIVKMC